MSDPSEERIPKVQPVVSRPPPRPLRPSAHGMEEPREDAGRTVYLLETMLLHDLARALNVKPFKLVADLLELKQFKTADDTLDFETASMIARKHGYRPERPPPGMLVL